MSLYKSYLGELDERMAMSLDPKPIDDEANTTERISRITDTNMNHREDSLKYVIYNIPHGTHGAEHTKANNLKENNRQKTP